MQQLQEITSLDFELCFKIKTAQEAEGINARLQVLVRHVLNGVR